MDNTTARIARRSGKMKRTSEYLKYLIDLKAKIYNYLMFHSGTYTLQYDNDPTHFLYATSEDCKISRSGVFAHPDESQTDKIIMEKSVTISQIVFNTENKIAYDNCPPKCKDKSLPSMEEPSEDLLEMWSRDKRLYTLATDGCKVHAYGYCRHGHACWLRYKDYT